jgi:hypothetical protein
MNFLLILVSCFVLVSANTNSYTTFCSDANIVFESNCILSLSTNTTINVFCYLDDVVNLNASASNTTFYVSPFEACDRIRIVTNDCTSIGTILSCSNVTDCEESFWTFLVGYHIIGYTLDIIVGIASLIFICCIICLVLAISIYVARRKSSKSGVKFSRTEVL